ncbi:MAG: ABC transporter ATP-binding protein [Alphaproteobacteria bacterium]|nr:ABC transporter ATP-binding protein [Alphaproteobacteria bacterium]
MISVDDLRFTFPGAPSPTLHGLTFEVRPGEVFGFLGPSGAGKSTTQRILTGLLHGFSGRVALFDRDVRTWGRDLYRRIGVGFETPAVHARLTAAENLRWFAGLQGVARPDVDGLLGRVGLGDAADQRVSEFSKGMRVRLDLCRALVHDPQLLFLDEPTSGLDPGHARTVRDAVAAIRDSGRTVFLTTHDMAEATELCDQVGFLVDGRLVAVGRPDALMRAHGKRRVAVTHPADDGDRVDHFPLDGLADDAGFLATLRRGITAIHSEEATLEQVFLAVTGRRLTA